MDNLPDASSALLSYIDALLVDEDGAVKPARASGEGHADKTVEVVPDPNTIRLSFFKIAGIPLAIEADDIAEVMEGNEVIMSPASERGASLKGVFHHQGRDIHVIDARTIILPQGHPALSEPQEVTGKHILMLADYDLALLCDEKGDIAALNRQEVEWRTQRQTRPWLAGIVKGHNRAVLDIEGLIQDCGLEYLSTY